jgi:hypothetical protein
MRGTDDLAAELEALESRHGHVGERDVASVLDER